MPFETPTSPVTPAASPIKKSALKEQYVAPRFTERVFTLEKEVPPLRGAHAHFSDTSKSSHADVPMDTVTIGMHKHY